MSDGGLLQKAIEQQSESDTVIDGVVSTSNSSSSGTEAKGLSFNLKLGAGLAVLGFILTFFISSPKMQSEYSLAILIPLLILGGSFYFVWTSFDRKKTVVLAVVYLLLLATPYALTSLTSGSITITSSQLSTDSNEITLTIRESGALFSSTSDSATISINYGDSEVYQMEMDFSIDRADGIGDYGIVTLIVSEFYQGNADNSKLYTVDFSSGTASASYTLDTSDLIRTVTDAQGNSAAAMGVGGDCDESKNSCVVGVSLRAWVGLDAMGNIIRPGAMPFADYTLKATLSIGGSSAIDYPEVSVVNTVASWDSMSGEYGSGSAIVGDFGSEITLDGSVDDVNLGMKYVPINDMTENDYGCYTFLVEVSQSQPWASDSGSVISTTYYEFSETGDDGAGNPTDESWTEVGSC
jgi:hypothetical protein